MPQATYLLWYPHVNAQRTRELAGELHKAELPQLCHFELAVRPPTPGGGMSASGVYVVNPPWTLQARVEAVLPQLAEVLRS